VKGPGLRLRYDTRRRWRCRHCGKTVALPGDQTAVACTCREPRPWMELLPPERIERPRFERIVIPEDPVIEPVDEDLPPSPVLEDVAAGPEVERREAVAAESLSDGDEPIGNEPVVEAIPPASKPPPAASEARPPHDSAGPRAGGDGASRPRFGKSKRHRRPPNAGRS